MLRSIAALAGASAVAAHGGMTTPLPRNSFNQPLDPSQPAVFGDMTNYYDVSVAPRSPAAPLPHSRCVCSAVSSAALVQGRGTFPRLRETRGHSSRFHHYKGCVVGEAVVVGL